MIQELLELLEKAAQLDAIHAELTKDPSKSNSGQIQLLSIIAHELSDAARAVAKEWAAAPLEKPLTPIEQYVSGSSADSTPL